MPFIPVTGDDEMRKLSVELQKHGSDYFYAIQLINAVVEGRYRNWEVYVYVDNCSQDCSSKANTYDSCAGVLYVDIRSAIRQYVFCCQQISDDMVISELKRNIDLSNQFVFLYAYVEYKPLIQRVCDGEASDHQDGFLFGLRHTENLPEIPDSNTGSNLHKQFEVRKIDEEYAEIVNKHWLRKTKGNLLMVQEELREGYGYGVFVGARMVSWIIRKKHCTMGNLFTITDFRRQGFASIVVSALSRDILAQGGTPFVHVEEYNTASAAFFKKLGFIQVQKFYNGYWIPEGRNTNCIYIN